MAEGANHKRLSFSRKEAHQRVTAFQQSHRLWVISMGPSRQSLWFASIRRSLACCITNGCTSSKTAASSSKRQQCSELSKNLDTSSKYDPSYFGTSQAKVHIESSTSHITQDAHILSIFPPTEGPGKITENLQWFHWWLDRQISTLPHTFYDILPEDVRASGAAQSRICKVFVEVARSVKAQGEPCIDCVVDNLVPGGLLKEDLTDDETQICRTLVFAMLGWQTMLYQPSFGTSPMGQFAVMDDFDGYHGQAFLAFKQDTKNSKRRLDEFLMGFGLLVSPKNTCFGEDLEENSAFDSITTVDPGEFNAYVLSSIAHVNIKWVDALSVHLEYNKATNTLYLFRYPSFCAASQPHVAKEDTNYAVIHW